MKNRTNNPKIFARDRFSWKLSSILRQEKTKATKTRNYPGKQYFCGIVNKTKMP